MPLTPTGVIVGEPGTEPIVPIGLLTTVLACEVSWGPKGLNVNHPQWGKLDVQVEDACPVLEHDVAMKLIHQIESEAKERDGGRSTSDVRD